jgi:hypothetical protein
MEALLFEKSSKNFSTEAQVANVLWFFLSRKNFLLLPA